MKLRTLSISVLIILLCMFAGCIPKQTVDVNLPNLQGQKVGLVSRCTADPQASARLALIADYLQPLLHQALAQTLPTETLYEVESAFGNEQAYPYVLRIAVEDLNGVKEKLESATVKITLEDTRTASTVYQTTYKEHFRTTESLVEKIIRRVPGRLSPETGGPLSAEFEWLDPLTPTPSASDYPNANAVYLVDEADVNIQIKEAQLWTPLTKYGNIYTKETRHVALKILTERGYSYAEVYIPFSEHTHVESLEARTITKDGQILPVSEDQIFEVNLFPEFVFFSDVKAKKFTFPAVEPGATIEYKYTVVSESVSMWGDFQFQRTEPVMLSRFGLDVPSGMKFKQLFHASNNLPSDLKAKTVDLSAWAVKGGYREKGSSKWGRRTYRYELSDIPATPLETKMPPWQTVGARLIFCSARFLDEDSQLEDFIDLGNWYGKLVEKSLKPNSALREQAKALTENEKTVADKVRAIYEHIQGRFRYVAVELGLGSVVPQKPSEVAQNQYGDCKGLSALMISMLHSIDIEAYPALLRTHDSGELDTAYVALPQFNHMIVYVQTDDKPIWVDATANDCTFGSLPWPDQGVTALVIKPQASHLSPTPTSDAQANQTITHWDVNIQPKGGLTYNVQTEIVGQPEHRWRSALRLLSDKEQRDLLQRTIAQEFPQAQLTEYQSGEVNNREAPMVLSYRFATPSNLQAVGDLLLFPMPGGTPFPNFTAADRVHPIHLDYAFHHIDEMTIHLPEGLTVEQLPESVAFKNRLGSVNVDFKPTAGAVTYRLEVMWNAVEIPPSQYKAVLQFQQQLAAIGQKNLVLKKNNN